MYNNKQKKTRYGERILVIYQLQQTKLKNKKIWFYGKERKPKKCREQTKENLQPARNVICISGSV